MENLLLSTTDAPMKRESNQGLGHALNQGLNTLTLQKDGTLDGTFSNGHDYTVSFVRPNK
jgi:hypothetical protein